jgi:hypothetical protein
MPQATTFEKPPRVRVFFGEKLETFLYIPEKAVPNIKADETVPE